jgi:hypothetical protein
MKRFLLILITAAMIAWAIWFGVRALHKPSSTTVAAFLPRETVFFAHLSDFNATRGQWHETDLYKLLHEPAMQEFLQKPLSNIPRNNDAPQKLKQIEKLELKDAFLAVTSIANNDVKVLGGFRFKGNSQDVEQLIGHARAKLLAVSPNAKRETIDYQQRKIETSAQGTQMVATVYDGNWFLAANDLEGIKTLMDRVDGRLKDQVNTLTAEAAFRSASAHMPANHAMFFYLQPKPLVEKLVAIRAASGNTSSPAQVTLLERMQSVCGAFGFDGGKMRDVSFVGMPKFSENRVLSRSSLAFGTKDTFLYADGVSSGQMPDLSDPNVLNAFPAAFKNMAAALSATGITKEDWRSAFDPEIGLLADWGAQARWPSILATMPVKDATKAKRIITTLTTGAATDGASWTQQEKNGALYFSMQSAGGFVSVAPIIAVSDHVVIAGLEAASVEAAMKRSAITSSELASSQNYVNAAHALPEPDQAFAYIDTALLYTRFDATLRPMLLMGAMFLPKVADYVDLSKWPPVEVITKHLNPVVTSTYYKNDGYVTESIGPVTFTQAAVGVGAIVGGSLIAYKHHGQEGGMGGTLPAPPLTQPGASPDLTPTPTPEETP